MADTPDLGAAETAFTEAETNFTTVEGAYNTAQEAFKADESNEDLKTAFTEQEALFNTATETRDTAKTALAELKSNIGKESWSGELEKYVSKQKDKDGNPLDDAAKEKLSTRLARYASNEAVFDAMINAQNKISSGGLIKPVGKESTPEEVEQYRKDMGIPEEAKGYDLTLGEGMVIGDDDKDFVDSFLEIAHKGNYSQQNVTDALNFHYQNEETQMAARHEADLKFHGEVEEELRQEWGPEFKANQNLMANYLATDFGEGVDALIVGARLADGTPLANHPDIIRGFVAKARAANPVGALVPGFGTKQHDAIVNEIETLEKEMGSDAWYKDDKKQERYRKLITARDNIK